MSSLSPVHFHVFLSSVRRYLQDYNLYVLLLLCMLGVGTVYHDVAYVGWIPLFSLHPSSSSCVV